MTDTEITIVLLPLRKAIPAKVLDYLETGIPQALRASVQLAAPAPPPALAWKQERQQYLGPALLDFLSEIHAPNALRLLAILDADAYMPGSSYSFGQATFGGREAFVALARLRTTQYFEALPVHEDIFAQRVLKEALHQLGHTFGLQHCHNTCVMRGADSRQQIDTEAAQFCAECRRNLAAQNALNNPT